MIERKPRVEEGPNYHPGNPVFQKYRKLPGVGGFAVYNRIDKVRRCIVMKFAVQRVELHAEPEWKMHLDGRPNNKRCGAGSECGAWVINYMKKVGQRRTAFYAKGELRKR